MADSVASRLRRAGLAGRTVTLKVRSADFITRTRSRSGPESLSDGPSIAARAVALLDGEDLSPGVRLLGVGVSNLTTIGAVAAHQMRLGLDGPGRWRGDGQATVPGVTRRVPSTPSGAASATPSVGPATLLGPGGVGVEAARRHPVGSGSESDDAPSGPIAGGDDASRHDEISRARCCRLRGARRWRRRRAQGAAERERRAHSAGDRAALPRTRSRIRQSARFHHPPEVPGP